ncbi:MAG TPA: rhodanese-like domain-containing protein [Pyrinomonadaceae bacterium]|jgi:hypothetical protein
MKRKFYTRPATALAALAAVAALLLGGCKATDTAGNTSAATTAQSKPGRKPTGGLTGGGGTAGAGTTEVDADGVRRVKPDELQAMVEGGQVVVYDTRSKMSYEQEHIRGSISMPHEDVSARAAEFPRDKTLVFYCT